MRKITISPLVSVIIPTYNRAHTLKRAVDSVLAQTYSNLELIVVNDGSDDATSQMMTGICDPRLQVIEQANQGVAVARNTGISVSSGSYIAFLDSDDAWKEEKLAIQLAFTCCGGWEISQTEEIWIRKGRRVNPGLRHQKPSGWIFDPSLELCLVSPSCVLMSRKCWDDIGPFDPRLLACEDYDLWLRCATRYPIGLVPFPLATRFAGHADQLSAKTIGLDLYRITSLCSLLSTDQLRVRQRRLAEHHLRIKGKRYVQGCLKRGREEEAKRVLALTADAGVCLFR
jgi:glycosyltransferase involved in cell wall biosynthesis